VRYRAKCDCVRWCEDVRFEGVRCEDVRHDGMWCEGVRYDGMR
jgi:hypothetical protein